jgi:phage terminase large subunit
VCATGLLNDEASAQIKPLVNHDLVVCDSAEPKSVTNFQVLGIAAMGAQKGPGSVEFGIKFLQGLEIIIHPRCQQARNEFATYKYKEDSNGNALPVPLDKNNHIIDAIRYATEDAYLSKWVDRAPKPDYDPSSRTKASYAEHAKHAGLDGPKEKTFF